MSSTERRGPGPPDAPPRAQVRWQVHLGLVLLACLVVGAYDLSGKDKGGWERIGHGMATLVGWGLIGSFTVLSVWLRYKKRAGVPELIVAALASPIVGQLALQAWLIGKSIVSSASAPRYDAHVTLERWWQRASGDELEVGAVVRSDVACSMSFSATVLVRSADGSTDRLDRLPESRNTTVELKGGVPATVYQRFAGGSRSVQRCILSVECNGVTQRYDPDETEIRRDTTTSWVMPLPRE